MALADQLLPSGAVIDNEVYKADCDHEECNENLYTDGKSRFMIASLTDIRLDRVSRTKTP